MNPSDRRVTSADDRLPPVEPPSAAFLVQLFLVPGIIVSIIVGVWLAFHWLAHLGNDPRAYVRTLRRDNEGRWQAALNLANELRGPGGAVLKADADLASDLGGILADEVASGRGGEQSQTLKMYLCRALGEFATPQAAPPLIDRAADPADPHTSRAAVEALAVLSTNLFAAGRQFADPAATTAAVIAASRSSDPQLRSSAAFTLGVLGGQESIDRLRELAVDDKDDVRFNAALALARQGSDEAFEPIGEMLALEDITPERAAAPDVETQSRRYKRALVVVNALRGVALLIDATHEPPPAAILDRIRRLAADPVGDVRSSAAELEKKIGRLSAGRS
jgi:HEAT repeat protein